MPEIHGSTTLKPPPKGKDILLEPEEFENLLYIWEFFNNFSDFLEIPAFDLSELQASLQFQDYPEKVHLHFEQEIDSSQELTNDPMQGFDWNQKATI